MQRGLLDNDDDSFPVEQTVAVGERYSVIDASTLTQPAVNTSDKELNELNLSTGTFDPNGAGSPST